MFSRVTIPGLMVLDRYIAWELIGPFLFGVGAFSSVGVAVGAVFELVRLVAESGLSLEIAVRVFLLKLPEFIAYAFPMSALLAALMTYSRLSSDSEILALRSVGVSVYRLVFPAVLMGLLVTGMTLMFYELFVPAANYEASITLERALDRQKPPFRQENILYTEYDDIEDENGEEREVLMRLFYAEQFNGEQMQGLTIVDRSQRGVSQIITSEAATWNPAQNTWEFFNGTMYLIDPDASYRNIVRFEHQTLELPRAPLDLAERGRDYNEMNLAQSLAYLNIIRHGGDEQKIQKLKVRIHQKVAFPFACLVFGFVGAALGTRPQTSGRATSFGISVVVIFCYYLCYSITGAMGQVGILSPFMAAWLTNFLGLGTGIGLLVKVAR